MQNNMEITQVGFGPRAAAFLADRLLLWLALGMIRIPAFFDTLFGSGAFSGRAVLFQYSALDVVCYVLSAVYFVLMTYYTGGTLGKKLMRLRVIRADGEPLRFIDVLYRETVGRFLSGILYIGYIMVLADKDHRALHDRLCGTYVVYDGVTISRRPEKPVPSYTVPAAMTAPAETEKDVDPPCS